MKRGVLLALVLAGGCRGLGDDARPITLSGPRIADLAPSPSAAPESTAGQPVTAEEVARWYRRALAEPLPGAARRAALKRLASLRLASAEDALAGGAEFDVGTALEAIARARAADPGSAELAYLEAHALALAGDEARSLHVLDEVAALDTGTAAAREARFRLAEAAFSAGRWEDAARGFGAVADPSSEFGLHATYMYGWARFKAGEPQLALDAFLDVLARLAELGALPPSMDELRRDVLRVVVFALSDLDGARTLAEAMAARGRPAWQVAIYEHLADTWLEQQRIVDAAQALETFVAENPLDAAAPRFALRRIEALRDGELAGDDELDALRADYVERFGAGSGFVAHGAPPSPEQRDAVVRFCARLATAAHVRAQQADDPAAWGDAARWHERRIANSPRDPDLPEWMMLAGEAHEQAGDLAHATATYHALAARFPDHPRAADAAYALTDLYRRTGSRELLAAEQGFVDAYPNDPRAPAVAVALAKGLYDDGQRQRSADLIDAALGRWNLGENERTARELAAAARLETGDYRRARAAYRVLLDAFGDPAHAADYRSRLLAATYRLGEEELAAGHEEEAMSAFAAMRDIDADAELTVAAEFRRVEIDEGRGDLAGALHLLDEIRARHPAAAAERDVDARLAELYERDGRPGAAAEEYARIAETERYSNEVRRRALFRSAELARTAGEDDVAAQRFETYLARWPEPLDFHAEALAQRIELARAGQGGVAAWLERELAWVEDLGENAPAVARERAARAAMELAEPQAERYYAQALGADLAHSLARKRDALTTAFEAYQRAVALGVAEVVTDAGYRAATLFEDFAAQLLATPRPDLDAKALEEYELLLEEQAYPFEERAIELHASNARLIPTVGLDRGTRASLAALARLSPGRWSRKEMTIELARTLQ